MELINITSTFLSLFTLSNLIFANSKFLISASNQIRVSHAFIFSIILLACHHIHRVVSTIMFFLSLFILIESTNSSKSTEICLLSMLFVSVISVNNVKKMLIGRFLYLFIAKLYSIFILFFPFVKISINN